MLLPASLGKNGKFPVKLVRRRAAEGRLFYKQANMYVSTNELDEKRETQGVIFRGDLKEMHEGL